LGTAGEKASAFSESIYFENADAVSVVVPFWKSASALLMTVF
jgi:hypothetical protein